MNGEMDEFDEKERERRKNDQIAYRNTKSTSNLFLFIGTILEIVISFAIIIIFILISVLLLSRVFDFPENVTTTLFQILLVIDFIGGLACGFVVYKKLGRWVIKKWQLEDKLRDDVLNQFKTRKEYKDDFESKNKR